MSYATTVPEQHRAFARYMVVVGGDVIDLATADADAVIAYYGGSRAIDLVTSACGYIGRITPQGTFAAAWKVHPSVGVDARIRATDAVMSGAELARFDPATAA